LDRLRNPALFIVVLCVYPLPVFGPIELNPLLFKPSSLKGALTLSLNLFCGLKADYVTVNLYFGSDLTGDFLNLLSFSNALVVVWNYEFLCVFQFHLSPSYVFIIDQFVILKSS
jgi:hypothetical protein